jgi:hypothetical protein
MMSPQSVKRLEIHWLQREAFPLLKRTWPFEQSPVKRGCIFVNEGGVRFRGSYRGKVGFLLREKSGFDIDRFLFVSVKNEVVAPELDPVYRSFLEDSNV